jgi:hypothetical protein
MVTAAATGELVDRDEGPFDRAEMQAWGKARTVRAAVLRHLLIKDQWPVDARGVRLRGVRISGILDLTAATLRCPLALERCYLQAKDPVCLDHATVSLVELTGCQLPGLTGGTLTARELNLSVSILTRPLQLVDANITGALDCDSARLIGKNADGNALIADRLKVGAMSLSNGFITGAVRMPGADIAGLLVCSGADLTGADNDGDALVADGMKTGHVFLDDGFTAAGAVRMSGAEITGQLSFRGAHLTRRNNDGDALVADGMKTGSHVFLDDGFTAAGAVRMQGAEITGQLSFNGAQLTHGNNDGNALFADGMKTGSDVLFDGMFTAAGAVRMQGAEVAGSLICRGACLTGADSDGDALVAGGLKTGRDVYIGDGFSAGGAVRLPRAEITGQLSFSGGLQLTGRNNDGHVLIANGMKAGSVVVNKGFTAAGAVQLPGAEIWGKLLWMPAEPVRVQVNLDGATIGTLEDDWNGQRDNGYWPADGLLCLDGLTYGRFGGDHGDATVEQRLAWIRSQYKPQPALRWIDTLVPLATISASDSAAAFATQPYEQLAAAYRRAGQDSEARKVAIARRRDLRRYGTLTMPAKVGNWLLDISIRYGYRTWRAVAALAVLYIAAVAIFWIAQHHGQLIIPVMSTKGLSPVPAAMRCTGNYPCFYPAAYAIDTVIPVINVHQATYWGPNGHAPWGHALSIFTSVGILLGWSLATLAVAGYTGLVRRD